MTDLTLTCSGEFDVVSVQAETGAGVEFLDAWFTDDPNFTVVDSGWLIVRDAAPLKDDADRAGLTVAEAVTL